MKLVLIVAAAAACAFPVSAQVLFSDDFNDGDAAGWQEFDGQFSVVNGQYRIQSTSFCGDARSVNGSPAWTDYAVDLDFYVDSAASNRQAEILFHVQDIVSGCDAGQYYQFHAYATYVGFCKMNYSQGACQILITAPYNTSNFTWHHARLEIVGTIATAFIDGQQVLTYGGFTDYASGRIGVKAINGNANLYDNVVVTSFPPPPPTITGISRNFSSLIGGIGITITGSGFLNLPSTVATVEGLPLAGMTVVSSTTIEGTTPPLPTAQVADVSVTTLGGTATLPGAVTYGPAMIGIAGSTHLGGGFDLRVASYPNSPIILLADTSLGMFQLGQFGSSGLAFSPALTPVLDFFGAFTGVPDSTAATDATGQWSVLVTVPNVPALAGTTIYGQVFVFSFFPMPPNTLFFIGNVLQLTFLP